MKQYFQKEEKQIEDYIVLKDYPYSIVVEPTAYCNLRCKMCANATMKREKGYMDFELYKKIVDQVAENFADTNFWINGYGEPLLHKEIFDMVGYASHRGIKKTFMNTNAMFLDEEAADRLIQAGIYCVVVSFDGFAKRTYETMRAGANRDVVIQNVTAFLERIKGIKGEKPLVELQFIEMPETILEKDEWLAFWQGKGAHIKIKPYITWGGRMETHHEILGERNACGVCNALHIYWNGKVPYCICDVDGEAVFADVREEKLSDIWNEKKQNFSEYHITHQFDKLPLFCQRCPDWYAMPAKHYDEYGNEVL